MLTDFGQQCMQKCMYVANTCHSRDKMKDRGLFESRACSCAAGLHHAA